MALELRNIGISIIGEVIWGTHIRHFSETKQDLFENLVRGAVRRIRSKTVFAKQISLEKSSKISSKRDFAHQKLQMPLGKHESTIWTE